MAKRAIPSISRKSARPHQYFYRAFSPVPQATQVRQISQIDFSDELKKANRREPSSPYPQFPTKPDQKSLTPCLSPINQFSVYTPKAEKLSTNRINKLSISFVTKKKESLRYKAQSLEENESMKNLNVVSTPPEEEISYKRSFSPFSDIIDEPLRNYIESPLPKIGKKFNLKKGSAFEDSGTYSINESKKQYKSNKKTWFKTPKTYSALGKLSNGKSIKLRNEKNK